MPKTSWLRFALCTYNLVVLLSSVFGMLVYTVGLWEIVQLYTGYLGVFTLQLLGYSLTVYTGTVYTVYTLQYSTVYIHIIIQQYRVRVVLRYH